MNLRSIRTPPGQPRKFPRGYGFNGVTCANYFFEAVSWLALCGMTGGDVAGEFRSTSLTCHHLFWLLKAFGECSGLLYPRVHFANDGMGRQETSYVQKGTWQELP